MSGQALLTEEDKRFFESSGYLVIRNATPVEEVERVRGIVASLVERRAGDERGDFLDLVGSDRPGEEARLPQILMPIRYAPEIANGRLREDAERIARELLGGPVIYEGEHIITKPPQISPETPLHQDEAHWGERTDYNSLSIWFPLQDTHEENGCLRFVPGSHKLDVQPHRSVGGDPRINGLELAEPQRFQPISEPLLAGGATVHHCRTIHGACSNRSPRPRYAYIMGFGLQARPRAEPRDFYWLKEKQLLREERARQGGYELTRMRPEL
jgi:ectoine hydroxylase-related dioxygenase (phytanoyl-CoA dioxygenase family)